jgi:preprotein translocase subunit SecA
MYEPIAKLVLISSLDMTWKDHLLSMDYLRESVSLRGYAQQNPLNEYKKEGYEMFESMLDNFNYEALKRFLEVVPITDEEIKEIEKTKDNNEDLSYTDDTAIENETDSINNDSKQANDKKLSQVKAKNKRRDLEKQKRKQRKKQRR